MRLGGLAEAVQLQQRNSRPTPSHRVVGRSVVHHREKKSARIRLLLFTADLIQHSTRVPMSIFAINNRRAEQRAISQNGPGAADERLLKRRGPAAEAFIRGRPLTLSLSLSVLRCWWRERQAAKKEGEKKAGELGNIFINRCFGFPRRQHCIDVKIGTAG